MPILFILFTILLFKILQRNNKKTGLKICRYVDDKLDIAKAIDKTKSTLHIQGAFRKVELWVYQNSIVFDVEKFEAIHFFQKKRFSNLDILISDNSLPSISSKWWLVKPELKTVVIH